MYGKPGIRKAVPMMYGKPGIRKAVPMMYGKPGIEKLDVKSSDSIPI